MVQLQVCCVWDAVVTFNAVKVIGLHRPLDRLSPQQTWWALLEQFLKYNQTFIVFMIKICDWGSHCVKFDSYRFTGFWDMAGDGQTDVDACMHRQTHYLASSMLSFSKSWNWENKKQLNLFVVNIVFLPCLGECPVQAAENTGSSSKWSVQGQTETQTSGSRVWKGSS